MTRKATHSSTMTLLLPLLLAVTSEAAFSYSDEVIVSGYSEVANVPYFLSPGNRNITTIRGQTAYLHCRVACLGDKAQVSWIRKRDLHVLSSGEVVFASDQRFQVLHQEEKSKNWTLQIKFTQIRDSGIYECQVNTVPKISMAYQLNVIESVADVTGPEYVKVGSTIDLTCTVNLPDMQGLIYWYHDAEMIKYYSDGIHIRTSSAPSGLVTSQLTIEAAQSHHSGNYTCHPTFASNKTVVVNVVLKGDQVAAMQSVATGGHTPNYEILVVNFLLFSLPGIFDSLLSVVLFS